MEANLIDLVRNQITENFGIDSEYINIGNNDRLKLFSDKEVIAIKDAIHTAKHYPKSRKYSGKSVYINCKDSRHEMIIGNKTVVTYPQILKQNIRITYTKKTKQLDIEINAFNGSRGIE
jgi:hypothetical protein